MVIELTDVETGEVETIRESNMITNAVNDLFSTNPFAVFYNTGNDSDKMEWNSNLMPICPNMIGGILLFSDTITENANTIYQYSDNMPVAYASNDVNATANTKRGSMNLTESMALTNGYKFVWEFTAGQGNGTIAAVALTSSFGGKNAYGSTADDASAFKLLKSVNLRTMEDDDVLLLYEAVEIDFANNRLYSITHEDNAVVITTVHLPMFTVGLNDTLDDHTLKVENTRTIVTTTFQFLTTYNQYGQFYDGKNGYWYGFANQGNSSGDATMYWVRISKSDYSKTEGVWTLSNAHLQPVGNQMIDSYPERTTKSCIRDGYLYVMAYDKTGVYKINVANQADVSLISLGFTSSFSALGGSGNSGLYMALIGDIIIGCDFQILDNDTVIQTAGATRTASPASPLFQYKEFLVGWGGSYGTRARYMFLLTPYLASINNLASPVVKTNSKTMKITYTLTESSS